MAIGKKNVPLHAAAHAYCRIITCQSAPQTVLLRHVRGVLQKEGASHGLTVDRNFAADVTPSRVA